MPVPDVRPRMDVGTAMPVLVASEDTKAQFTSLLLRARQGRGSAVTTLFPWQARMATTELLDLAIENKSPVRLLTGTACELVYQGSVMDKLTDVVKKGSPVKVLIWNDQAHGAAPWLADLASAFDASQLEVRVSGTRELGEEISHFLVVGESGYRLEMPHPYVDRNSFDETSPEIKGIVRFAAGSESDTVSLAKVLVAQFDRLWNSCGI